MPTPATIPFTAAPPKTQPKPQPWSPDTRDRLIFQWVKFDGHQQSWVAEQLEIHQTTVSRIVDRYERWIARGGPSQQGAPSQDERLRAQRWLAYERNEWILASALRIAGEMERALDTTESTVLHPRHDPSQQSKVRTEYKVIDRSGIAARFLRLAYRINMDQLKLVEQDPLPALEPLTTADLADDLPLPLGEGQGEGLEDHPRPLGEGWGEGLETDSIDDTCSPGYPPSGSARRKNIYGLHPATPEPDDTSSSLATRAETAGCHGHPARVDGDGQPSPTEAQLKTENRKLDAPAVSVIELTPNALPMHTTHKLDTSASTLTPTHQTASVEYGASENTLPPAYAVALGPPVSGDLPEWQEPSEFTTLAGGTTNPSSPNGLPPPPRS